eukprot:2182967-Pleurochrysis_carterae.AAC.1
MERPEGCGETGLPQRSSAHVYWAKGLFIHVLNARCLLAIVSASFLCLSVDETCFGHRDVRVRHTVHRVTFPASSSLLTLLLLVICFNPFWRNPAPSRPAGTALLKSRLCVERRFGPHHARRRFHACSAEISVHAPCTRS